MILSYQNSIQNKKAMHYNDVMKFKIIFDRYPSSKVMACSTDFSVNSAYKDDEEFIRFTKEKIDIRNYAKKHYDKNKRETIRFYLYNIVSIALKLEGYRFKYWIYDYDKYDYENELSKELILKVRELYRKYLPLYDRLINHVIHDSRYTMSFADVFIKHMISASLKGFFILGNVENRLTLVIALDEEVKDYLINEVKGESEFGRTYFDYALYKDIHLGNDEWLYGCVPHEDCQFENEDGEVKKLIIL